MGPLHTKILQSFFGGMDYGQLTGKSDSEFCCFSLENSHSFVIETGLHERPALTFNDACNKPLCNQVVSPVR